MKVVNMAVDSIKPYAKNAKKHPDDQVKLIANSIKQFGFQQPIVVDKDNVIVIGHGRLLAAKRLKLAEVPVVRIENLSENQVKALRIADNSVGESDWNLDLLAEEIADIDLDMSDFGIDLDLGGDDDEDDGDFDDLDLRPASLRHNVFENQELRQFAADNYYGIPTMKPTQTVGDKMLRFCDFNSVSDPENYIVHFYYDDFKFIQAWRDPDRYVEKLRKFKAVVSPDFSLYTDFPRCLQILSCYRRQWVGAYWQELGLDVIPDVVWGDKDSFAYCFEGIPKGGTVAVSSVGVKNDDNWNNKDGDLFKAGYDEMMNRLEPTTVLFYGDMIDGLEGNIIQIPSYYAQKREYLNQKAKEKQNG